MTNTELAEKVHAFITLNPDQYQQSDWTLESESECGTRACVAGWAAILGRDLPLKSRIIPGYVSNCSCCPTEEPYTEYYYDEPSDSWQDAGRQELGISEHLASYLFRGTNNEKRTVEAVRMLADGDAEEDIIEHLTGYTGGTCNLGCCDLDNEDEDY